MLISKDIEMNKVNNFVVEMTKLTRLNISNGRSCMQSKNSIFYLDKSQKCFYQCMIEFLNNTFGGCVALYQPSISTYDFTN